jgi:hypothetical protein
MNNIASMYEEGITNVLKAVELKGRGIGKQTVIVGVNMIKVQYTHVKVPKQNPFEQ